MARVLIGISSWADKGLVASTFYPESSYTPADRLGYYSHQFPLAEIDSSYHHFPMRRELDLWLSSVPEGFVFDVKAFSLFTQHPTQFKALPRTIREEFGGEITTGGSVYWRHLPEKASARLWEGFALSLEAFKSAGKLGVVFFQFPPWFHPNKENFDYISCVKDMLREYRLAVEFRYEAWLNETNREGTLDFLKDREISLVCVDEPQGFRSSIPPLAVITAPTGIVRFHGRNTKAWEQKNAGPEEKFDYLYKSTELEEWLPRVREMAGNADEVHIIFKNKHADYPVRNARQFGRMLGAQKGKVVI